MTNEPTEETSTRRMEPQWRRRPFPGAKPAAVAALLTVIGSVGCAGDGPRSLDWSITYAEDDASLADRTTVIEAVIRQDGCSGERVFEVMVRRGSMPMQPEPPVLDTGVYGFSGHARDSSCRVVAEACEAVELPQDDPLELRLRAIEARAECPAERCRDGQCVSQDGGSPMDAGEADAALREGGAGADSSSGARDSGASMEAGHHDGGDGGPMDG